MKVTFVISSGQHRPQRIHFADAKPVYFIPTTVTIGLVVMPIKDMVNMHVLLSVCVCLCVLLS